MRCVTCRKWSPCISRSRFRDVLASFDRMTLNCAAIGRRLALSRTTASTWVRAYERAGLLHLLPSLERRRRPLLLVSPRFTDDSGSLCAARVLESLQETVPSSRFHYWNTGRVRMIPLIADTGAERIGFCFSTTPVPQRRQWLPLLLAMKRHVIDRAFLLHENTYATVANGAVLVLPRSEFLREIEGWVIRKWTLIDARQASLQSGRKRLVCWHAPR